MLIKILKQNIKYLLLLCTVLCFAQKEIQGQAFYDSKTSIDMENFGRENMSEARKREMAERMRSNLEKSFVLTFNQTESIYTEEEKTNAWRGGRFRMMLEMTSGPHYKNIKEELLLQEQVLLGKKFLIKDSLPNYNWKMLGESKQIGDYMCFKATTKKSIPTRAFGFGRPSRDKSEAEQTKEIEIVAWYTLQVPVNQGPGDYWGLPGLILELNAGRTTIFCTKLIINSEDKMEIERPSKGKEISKSDFEAMMKEKLSEMRSNFREDRRN